MEIGLSISKQPGQAFYVTLVESLITAIQSGQLKPGQQLPPVRTMANLYHTSNSTVSRAYEVLLAQSYIRTSPKEGTYVSAVIPCSEMFSEPSKTQAEISPKQTVDLQKLSPLGSLLMKDSTIKLSDATSGLQAPSADCLPVAAWSRYLASAKQKHTSLLNSLNYGGMEFGLPELRNTLADYFRRSKGIHCGADQILIIAGSRFDLCCRTLIAPGDTAVVENPGYPVLREILKSHGARVIGAKVDSNGLIVENLHRLTEDAPNLKMVCVSPSQHDPTGVVMPLSRREELLQFASRKGCFIWENNFASQFRYTSAPLPAMKSIDRDDNVIFSGDFWMTMGPLAKLGYIVLPRRLVPVFQRLIALCGNNVSLLEQLALQQFIQDGQWERHILKTKAIYARKRQILLQSLEKYFGSSFSTPHESSAVHLMMTLNVRASQLDVLQAAAESGLTILSTENHYMHGRKPALEFLVRFSTLIDEEIDSRVKLFAHRLNFSLLDCRPRDSFRGAKPDFSATKSDARASKQSVDHDSYTHSFKNQLYESNLMTPTVLP